MAITDAQMLAATDAVALAIDEVGAAKGTLRGLATTMSTAREAIITQRAVIESAEQTLRVARQTLEVALRARTP